MNFGKIRSWHFDVSRSLWAHERQAAEELGQWVATSETQNSNASVIIDGLNAGRQRAREAAEKRQAIAAGANTEERNAGGLRGLRRWDALRRSVDELRSGHGGKHHLP